MSCGRHTTRRQAHSARRAKTSHTVRKAAHATTRKSVTAPARKATSPRAAHKQVRKIGKARPKTSKTTRPKKTPAGKKSAASLKAHTTAHKTASKTARAHARATAAAKARAKAKTSAGRPATKTTRSHAKTTRLYCRIASRTAITVVTAKSPVVKTRKAVKATRAGAGQKASRAAQARKR